MRANIKKISSCISLFFFQTNKQSQIQGFATFTVKQLLNLSRSNPYHLPPGLRQVSTERKDTEGNIIQLEALYELSNGYVAEAIDYLQSVYPNLRLVPIGGQSAGGGVFAVAKKSNEQQTVGLQILPPAAITDKQNITYTISDEAPTEAIRTQEIHILRAQKIAYVGAGVVLDQLQTTVHEALGKNFAVQGTDLTSSPYASCGATFMTGGMGPARTNFAHNVIAINFYDGETSRTISDKNELVALAETYGWTGFVQSIVVPIIEVPPFEFGFAVPVNNTPAELATLVNYFADKTVLSDAVTISEQILVAGLEIITGKALQLIFENSPNMHGLELLMQNCKAANKDSVVFISGSAAANPFEDINDPLGIFADNATTGLALEQATPFANLQAMKAIREGAPELARRQYLNAAFYYKDHTDINVVINLASCTESVSAIMTCYENYKTNIEKLIQDTDKLDGNVQVYGHLNPQGLDPHYRITLVAEDEEIITDATKKAKKLLDQLVVNINYACIKTASEITGGEKGIISNMKIFFALVSQFDKVPKKLQTQLQKQSERIPTSNQIFRWRVKGSLSAIFKKK